MNRITKIAIGVLLASLRDISWQLPHQKGTMAPNYRNNRGVAARDKRASRTRRNKAKHGG